MKRFNENDRVILAPHHNQQRGDGLSAPAQEGTLIAEEGNRTWLVSIDRAYRNGDGDDGIREVREAELLEHNEMNLRQCNLFKEPRQERGVRRKR